jgi:hypothetical protein
MNETKAVFYPLFSALWKKMPVVLHVCASWHGPRAQRVYRCGHKYPWNTHRGVRLVSVTAHYALFTGLSLAYQFKQSGTLRQHADRYHHIQHLLVFPMHLCSRMSGFWSRWILLFLCTKLTFTSPDAIGGDDGNCDYELHCGRFHDTSDMDAAIQRPDTDSGVSYATVFLIHGTTASIPRQRLGKQLLSLQRMLTKVIPVITTRITEENLPIDKVSYIRYGRIGFKENSDSQKFSYE